MACLSDMQVEEIHPGMQLDSSATLLTLAGWDTDRLSRIARWKTSPGTGKEIIKAYSKVVLALSELHQTATHLDLSKHVPSLHCPPNSERPNSDASCARVAGGTIASPTPAQEPVQALAKPAIGRRLSHMPSRLMPSAVPLASLPAEFWNVWRTWSTAFALASQVLLTFAAWIPVLVALVGIVVLLSDPSLFLRLCWEALRVVPKSLRASLDQQPQMQSALEPQRQTLSLAPPLNSAASYDPPPAFAHPSYAVSHPEHSWWSPLLAFNVELGGGTAVYYAYVQWRR